MDTPKVDTIAIPGCTLSYCIVYTSWPFYININVEIDSGG